MNGGRRHSMHNVQQKLSVPSNAGTSTAGSIDSANYKNFSTTFFAVLHNFHFSLFSFNYIFNLFLHYGNCGCNLIMNIVDQQCIKSLRRRRSFVKHCYHSLTSSSLHHTAGFIKIMVHWKKLVANDNNNGNEDLMGTPLTRFQLWL